jgi:hypothetical protein
MVTRPILVLVPGQSHLFSDYTAWIKKKDPYHPPSLTAVGHSQRPRVGQTSLQCQHRLSC